MGIFERLYFIIGASSLILSVTLSQDYPNYSEGDLPETRFTCTNKVQGGYYADIETGCQMYHICARDADGIMRSNKFLCGNETVFDQRKLVCQDYKKVQCSTSPRFYKTVTARIVEARMRNEERVRDILVKERDREILEESYIDYPHYEEADLPLTSFNCLDKVNGAYYADIETGCKMYHICSRNENGRMRSTRFLCGNETVFDQHKLVCQDYKKVQCSDSTRYYKTVAPRTTEVRMKAENMDREILEDYPIYSAGNLPKTSFTCKDKVQGGHYADIETDCQMYHVCSKNKFGRMRSTRFLCGNGTVFDQRHLVCQDFRKVPRCHESPKHYRNAAVLLERLEEGLRSDKRDKEIMNAARFESGRN